MNSEIQTLRKHMDQQYKEISIADIIRFLFDRWLLIGIFASFGLASATLYAYMAKVIYRAEVLVSPAQANSNDRSALGKLAAQLGPISGMLGSFGGGAAADGKDVWVAIVKSRRFTESFIQDLDLLPALFPEQWNKEKRSWKLSQTGSPQKPTMENAYKLFDGSVRRLSEDRKTGLITVSVTWTDPLLAAVWANETVRRANDAIRSDAMAEARRSIDFLQAELKKTEIVGLQQVIFHQIEAKISDIVVANVRKDYAFVVIDPAQAPSTNNFVKPRRRFIMAVGLMLGFIVGCAVAMARQVFTKSRV